jgi:hypothetical protein
VPDSDVGQPNFTLTVSATASDGSASSAPTTQNIVVTVHPVAEASTLTVPSSVTATNGGSPVSLSITDTLTESLAIDPDSSLGNVTITGMPSGVTFNHGTLSAGTLTLSADQLAGLTMTVAEPNSFNLTVTASTSDGGNIAFTSRTINVTVAASLPRLVISEGVTNIDITSFLGAGTITGTPSIVYPAGVTPKGYTVTLSDGHVYLTVDNNVPGGGGQSAPDVNLSYTLNGQSTSAVIKAINVTPGNNSSTLDLTSSAVGAYGVSYLTPQPSGKSGETIVLPTSPSADIFAYTSVTDSIPGAFDTILNFDPTSDKIDFSEIQGITSLNPLGTLSAIPGTAFVAAHSITWFVDTATNQTIIFVNSTSAAQSANKASMEVVLAGQKSLSPSNFVLSEAPLTLSVTNHSLSVTAGGNVALPIVVSNLDFGDNVAVQISGLAKYETVTDTLDGKTFSGSSIVLTAAEVNSGLSLHSSYTGNNHPVNTLTVTATNSSPGETSETIAAQTITVTDPPSGSTTSVVNNSSANSATISGTETYEFVNASAENVSFAAGAAGTLKLDQSSTFTGVISGFAAGDSLDLADIAFHANTTLGYSVNADGTGGTLSISDGAHGASIALFGQYAAAGFHAGSDSGAGAIVTYADPGATTANALITIPNQKS